MFDKTELRPTTSISNESFTSVRKCGSTETPSKWKGEERESIWTRINLNENQFERELIWTRINSMQLRSLKSQSLRTQIIFFLFLDDIKNVEDKQSWKRKIPWLKYTESQKNGNNFKQTFWCHHLCV